MHNPTIILARAPEARIDPSRSVSLRGLLHIVFKRKWLILLVFVLTSAAATIYALYLAAVPQYAADAEILVSPDDVRLPASAPSNAVSREEQIARTIRLLVGRSLAEEVVENIGPTVLYEQLARNKGRDEVALRRTAAARLVNNLSVDPAGRSSIIVLSFRHEDPVLAARVVNLLSEMYVDRHLRVEKNPRSDAFFREQLEVLKKRLGESQQALDTFRQRHDIVDTPKGGRERAAAEIAGLSSALVEARSRQAGLEGQIAILERKLEREAQIPRSYYQTKERVQELQVQESQLAATLMPQHPQLSQVQDEIRSLREVLAATGAGAPYETAAEQEQVRVTTQTELARMRAEAEATRVNQGALSAQLEEARARLQAMANIDTEFNQLQEQLRTDEQNYSLYLGRVEGGRMARAMDEEKIVGVRVIEPAQIPMYPLESKRNRTIALGLVLGAGGGIAAAFLMHFLAGRLDTREDVERLLGLPVLASIAENQLRPAADAASIHDRRRDEDARSL